MQTLVGRGSSPHCYLPPHGAQPGRFLERETKDTNNSPREAGSQALDRPPEMGATGRPQIRLEGTELRQMKLLFMPRSPCLNQGHAQEGLALPWAPLLRPGRGRARPRPPPSPQWPPGFLTGEPCSSFPGGVSVSPSPTALGHAPTPAGPIAPASWCSYLPAVRPWGVHIPEPLGYFSSLRTGMSCLAPKAGVKRERSEAGAQHTSNNSSRVPLVLGTLSSPLAAQSGLVHHPQV